MLSLAQLLTPPTYAGWLGTLLTALQGVSVVTQDGVLQTSGVYAGSVVQIGTGSVQAIGPAIANASVVIQIQQVPGSPSNFDGGNCGTGLFNYSLDGGNSFSANGPFPIPANVSPTQGTFLITEINVTLIFSNGQYTSPSAPLDSAGNPSSFVLDETYNFTASIPTFPVSNWGSGAPGRTLTQADAQALLSLATSVQQVVAGGFAQSWIVPPAGGPPPSGWLDLLSQGQYNRLRYLGAQTQGLVLMQAAKTAGPYVKNPGTVTVVSSQGQRFTNLQQITIPKGGSVLALFGAVQVGSVYNGVASFNPQFSGPVSHTGNGTGLVTFNGVPYTYQPVVLITTASSGATYGLFDYSIDGGTTFTGSPQAIITGSPIPLGATGISLTFAGAEAAGVFNLNDTYSTVPQPIAGSNTITQLVTPLPGVTVGNYLLDAPAVAHSGTGAGTIAVSGIPTAELQVAFTVTRSGQPAFTGTGTGSAVFSGATAFLPVVKVTTASSGATLGDFDYSLDNGVTYTGSPQAITTGSPIALGASGASVTFTGAMAVGVFDLGDIYAMFPAQWSYTTSTQGYPVTSSNVAPVGPIGGMSIVPSGLFEVGDTYTFSTRWISQLGADVQTDFSLASADQNQWAQLSPASPTGTYQNWAIAASPEVVSSFVSVAPIIPGQIDIVLVGSNNAPVSATAIDLVYEYISARVPDGVQVQVATVSTINLTITGTAGGVIQCSPGLLSAAQQAVAAALYKLQLNTAPGGIIPFGDIFSAIQDAVGVVAASESTLQIAIGAASPVLLSAVNPDYVQLQQNQVGNFVPPPNAAYGFFA